MFLQGSVSVCAPLSSDWILFCVVFVNIIFRGCTPHFVDLPHFGLDTEAILCLPSVVEQAIAKSVRSWLLSPFPYGDGCLLGKIPRGELRWSKGNELCWLVGF